MRWRLLQAIADDPGHGPSFYAARLDVPPGTVSRAADRLQELRYITRKPVPDHANHIAMRLTGAGRKALETDASGF